MPASGYVLFIVESPVIARIIQRYQIPGLEVIPTNGYAWFPEIDSSKKQLKFRANPDLRDFRTELKKKAGWASKIIIATDDDSSGGFIAAAIARYLKGVAVFTTQLRAVNRYETEQAIENASIYTQDADKQLYFYFTFRNKMSAEVKQKYGHSVSLEQYLVSLILQSAVNTSHWYSENGHLFRSAQPVNADYGKRMKISFKEIGIFYETPPHPPSLADIMMPSMNGFETSYLSLKKLFVFHSSELKQGLISYPRTAARYYRASVWEYLSAGFLKADPGFTAIPKTMRRTGNSGHPAVHVLHPDITPNEVRPYLRKEQYEYYKRIYNRVKTSLQIHPNYKKMCVYYSDSNTFLYCASNPDKNHEPVFPLYTLSEFMQSILNTGCIKPSALAKVMDSLIKNEIINVEHNPVPHVLTGKAALDINKSDLRLAAVKQLFVKINDKITNEEALNFHYSAIFNA